MSEVQAPITNSDLVIPNARVWSKVTGTIFIVFAISWALTLYGFISIDFSLFFFLLSVITGFYWLRERKVWKVYLTKDNNGEWNRPWWLAWTAGIFPVVLGLFLFRGFIAEPFKIPTGSMIPTIMIGDVSIINKFYYDIKIPVIEKSIYSNNEVKRGDIVVFRFPVDPSVYYIKRFIGMPGDKINYNFENKILTINNEVVKKNFIGTITSEGKQVLQFEENLFGVKHKILENPDVNSLIAPEKINNSLKACTYTLKEMTCVVPKDSYFAMGDNRDNSLDSRYWGFVPKDNVVGKATMIIFTTAGWSHFGSLN